MVPNNLPVPLTRFIGREREIAALTGLLLDDSCAADGVVHNINPPELQHHRLMTLTGVGGCGKTRLAIEAAQYIAGSDDLAAHFPEGIWFIGLAGINDPDLIAHTIFTELNLAETPYLGLLDSLTAALRTHRALLLIDNCEHQSEASAQLAERLLTNCPGIVILATSRAPLNLSGEKIFPVLPLEIINPGEGIPLTNLVQCESVRLFVDRAAAIDPLFALNERNSRAVLRICQLLDGIPLAIELAAARARTLTAEEIAERLGDMFQLLHSSSPTVIPRHQNLHVAFDWSFSLLTEPEKALFRRLGVFHGGWTLEAAEHVALLEPVYPGQMLDLHERLLDQSLIVRMDDREAAQARYGMLMPVRQYAGEMLAGSGEFHQMRDNHLSFFASLAERVWDGLHSPEYHTWVRRTRRELDNIRYAFEWSLADGNFELGLRLVNGLFMFWQNARLVTESITIFQNLINHPKAADPSLRRIRGKALALLSISFLRLSDYQNAMKAAEDAIAIASELHDSEIAGYALVGLGHSYGLQERYGEAQAYLEESLTRFREQNNIIGQAWALSRLGTVALHMAEYEQAIDWLEPMADLMRDIGNINYLGYALSYWGYALLGLGDVRGAMQKFLETREFDVEPEKLSAPFLIQFAVLANIHGQKERATRLLGKADLQRSLENTVIFPYELQRYARLADALRNEMGETAFSHIWEAGRRLNDTQANAEISVIISRLNEPPGARQVVAAALTERELEVLRLLSLGKSNQEIAEQLVISRRTVHAHLRSIYGKLDVTTRTAAAYHAQLFNLV